MLNKRKYKLLGNLYQHWSGSAPENITPLPVAGSNREYFRIRGNSKTAVGVFSPNARENVAFLSFTRHFRKSGLNVPELYAEDIQNNIYLIQDLGDQTLYSFMMDQKGQYTPETDRHYRSALKHLVRFQTEGLDGLDLALCIPGPVFDSQAVKWDLDYFKYYALKLFNIPFDEDHLEKDFKSLSNYITTVDNNYFMYRDFQSRNILIHDDDLYFVDYQGGRRGPCQYDAAALLFEAKINQPHDMRLELLEYYISEITGKRKIDKPEFVSQYYHIALIRILQALAAFGLRGYVENKSLFLESYPFALHNLKWLLNGDLISLKLPELRASIGRFIHIKEFLLPDAGTEVLNVQICSFAFKKGIPKDLSGHGGGFVFDCRALPNPGKLEAFKNYNGHDEPVIQFLEKEKQVAEFIQDAVKMTGDSINAYLRGGYNRLMVSFGCTGGQHRSVYCAEKLAEHIRKTHPGKVMVSLIHRELDED